MKNFIYVFVLIVTVCIGCMNKTTNKVNNVSSSDFSKQELFLISKLCKNKVGASSMTHKDSMLVVTNATLEITTANADYYKEMTKFGQKHLSHSKDENFLYKQYKYALKLFKDNNALTALERKNNSDTDYNNL